VSNSAPSEIQAWVRGLEKHLAPSTIEVVYSFVAGVFRAAERDRLIIATPCVDVRLPKREPKRVEPLATELVEALIAAMPQRYRALVVLAAGTGVRHGEALGLEVEAVDFLRRTLEVRQQLVTMPGKPPYLAPPKTPASYRTIPLPQPDHPAAPGRRRCADGAPGRVPGRRGRDPGHNHQAGPEMAFSLAGLHQRRRPADPPDPILDHLAPGGQSRRS
jgi:integrase